MSFFRWPFGRTDKKPEAPKQADECRHTGVLVPRWDSVADIGHEDKIVAYWCNACGKSLSLEEAAQLRQKQ